MLRFCVVYFCWNSSFLSNQPVWEENWLFLISYPFYLPLATSENWAVMPLQGNPAQVLSVPGRSWIAEMPPARGWLVSSAIQDLQKLRSKDKKRVFSLFCFLFLQHSKLYVLSRQKFCLFFFFLLSVSVCSCLFVNFQVIAKKNDHWCWTLCITR